jgi:phosphohistidine phosphatase
MHVYLVQHADAKKEQEDPLRPLTEKGWQDITRVASYTSHLNMRLSGILHSTKLRAKQSAEILFSSLRPVKGVTEVDGLAPLDDPNIWAERLNDMPDDVLLVGHLPYLARLASLLLCSDAERNMIAFRMACIVCLRKDEGGAWSLEWMLTPDVIIGDTGTGYSCDGL